MVRRARVLGEGPLDQARLVAAACRLRLPRQSKGRPLILNLKLGARRTPYWVCDLSHLYNLDEVWVRAEYELIAHGEYHLILHLGANVGAASIWLHERHPDAQILAVEPDPLIAPLLRRNTQPFERITVVQAAVGVDEGIAQLRSGQFSWHSSIVGDEASEAAAGISVVRTSTVKVTTIPALLRDVGLPSNAKVLAKMDVEGSEWALLRQPDALRQLSEIYGETHAVGAPADPDSFLRRASAGAGFERVDAGQGFVHWRRPPDRCFVASPTDSCHLARPFTDLSPLDDAADATH